MKFIPIAIILSIIVCSLASTEYSQQQIENIVKGFNKERQNIYSLLTPYLAQLNWNSQLEVPDMDCGTTLVELQAKLQQELANGLFTSSSDDSNNENTISKCYNLRISNINCVKKTCSGKTGDFEVANCVCGVWPRITTPAPTTVATTTTITTTTVKPTTTTTDNECGDDDELCEDGSSNLSVIAPVFFTVIFYLLA